MQKYVIFVKKSLKVNILKVKNIAEIIAMEYRSAVHSICNLKIVYLK